MQEWVTVIIVLLILAILLDGVRRMRINQRDKIRMSRSIRKQTGSEPVKEKDQYTSELPNGGARVIGYREPPQQSLRPPRKTTTPENPKRRPPEQTRLNLDEAVPLLMESVQDDVLLGDHKESSSESSQHARNDRQRVDDRDRIEPTFTALDDEDLPATGRESFAQRSTNNIRTATSAQETISRPVHDYDDDDGDDYHRDSHQALADDLDDEKGYGEEDYAEEDYAEDGYAEDYDGEDYDEDDEYDDDEEYEEDNAPLASDQPAKEPEEVLIINVMSAKHEFFHGTALLDIILKCGMRYGDMNIFHRYTDTKGEGALLFSMANMVKPGTFDLDAMDQFETPGVSLFMTLPIKADSMQSFELMVDTARAIAETLGGELKDEQRSVMTRQTVEHCRQRIRDYELKKLSRGRQ